MGNKKRDSIMDQLRLLYITGYQHVYNYAFKYYYLVYGKNAFLHSIHLQLLLIHKITININ